MLIKNVTRTDLTEALRQANDKFGGNLCFREDTPECKGKTREGGQKFRIRLGVKDCHSPGARVHIRYEDPFGRAEQKTRHSRHACWHAHGEFFDSLPVHAVITTGKDTFRPGDPWTDWNVGSIVCPVYFSESCDCGGEL